MSDAVQAEGGCRCGQVRFRVTGAPLFTAACHCRGCQLMTSSAFSLASFYPADRFELLSGALEPGGLRGENRHLHCPNCMGWVMTLPHGVDHIVSLRSALLDTPSAEPPFVDFYRSSGFPWVRTGARHRYDSFPPPDAYPMLMAEYAQDQGAV